MKKLLKQLYLILPLCKYKSPMPSSHEAVLYWYGQESLSVKKKTEQNSQKKIQTWKLV